MITGTYELDVQELEEKLGIMANTTKCCATGTCDEDEIGPPTFMATPKSIILKSTDLRDPLAIREKYGVLV